MSAAMKPNDRRAAVRAVVFAAALAAPGCSLATSFDNLAGGSNSGPDASHDGGAGDAAGAVGDAGASDGGPAAIVWRSSSNAIGAQVPTITVPPPPGTMDGDMLIATIGFGNDSAMTPTTITPPTDWTLLGRSDHMNVGSLAAFSHVRASGDAAYTWTTSTSVGSVGVISAYTGVDPLAPVDVQAGQDDPTQGTSFSSPSVTTTTPGDVVVVAFFGYTAGTTPNSWTLAGVTQRADVYNNGQRSVGVGEILQPTPGVAGPFQATSSATLFYGVSRVFALRPQRCSPTRNGGAKRMRISQNGVAVSSGNANRAPRKDGDALLHVQLPQSAARPATPGRVRELRGADRRRREDSRQPRWRPVLLVRRLRRHRRRGTPLW
jgi:hypothetical protein